MITLSLNQFYHFQLFPGLKRNKVKVASKVTGLPQTTLPAVYEQQVARKARAIVESQTLPLHRESELLPSGCRYRTPRVRCNRTKNSFVSSKIAVLNRFVIPLHYLVPLLCFYKFLLDKKKKNH